MFESLNRLNAITCELVCYQQSYSGTPAFDVEEWATLLKTAVGNAESTANYFASDLIGLIEKKDFAVDLAHLHTITILILDRVYDSYCSYQSVEPADRLCYSHYYTSLLTAIDRIHQLLSTHFSTYLNASRIVSVYHLEQYRLAYSARLPTLNQSLNSLRSVDTQLVSICLAPIQELVSGHSYSPYTYQRFHYLSNLYSDIASFKGSAAIDFFTPLEQWLICYNFNAVPFYHYLQQRLQSAIVAEDDCLRQRQFWLRIQHDIIQLVELSTAGFMPHQLSVQQQLLRFVDSELLLLEPLPMLSSPKASAVVVLDRPLRFSISISQVAVIVRLLVTTGVIKTDNQTAFIKQLAGLISSDRSAIVSADSFRNKYYSPDRRTIHEVKALFFDLIKQLHRLE
jgi:hypothetical protein